MTSIRQFVPGQFEQGEDEQLSYVVDVTNWTAAPAGASVVVKVGSSDVSASVLRSSGSAVGVTGASITTPCFINLASGSDYRAEVKFEESGLIYEGFFYVTGAS